MRVDLSGSAARGWEESQDEDDVADMRRELTKQLEQLIKLLHDVNCHPSMHK